jgi:hypothetical protein
MISHPDVFEKLVASRQAQIRHEMHQIHMSQHVRQQRTLVRSTFRSIGKVLIVSGSFLQRIGQQSKASLHTS